MLLASIASVASILCLCCLWCTRSSVQQLARSRHSNTNVGFAVYTLDVHCISLVATDIRYVICGVNWAASLPSSLLRLPPSISPWARHSSTSQNPLQYLDLKTILASPEQEWPDQIIWTINLESLYTLPSSCRPQFLVCKFVLPPSAPHWLWASANWSMQTWFLCKM